MEEVTQKMASAQIKDVQAKMKQSQKKDKKGKKYMLFCTYLLSNLHFNS